MNKYSPGPWRWKTAVHSGGTAVGCVDSADQVVIGLNRFTPVRDEDARLIAAAPEMLSLLRRFVDECMCEIHDGGETCPHRQSVALLARIDG